MELLCCQNMALEDRLHQSSNHRNMTDLTSSGNKAIKSRMNTTDFSLTKSIKNMKKEIIKPKKNNILPESQPGPEKLESVELLKQVDPKVKKMIEQIVDATQMSHNDAYLALHDSEYNVNDAVNLLLEVGGNNEWSLAAKKKKTKTPGEKTEKNNIEKPRAVIHENGSCASNTKPSIGSRFTNYRGTNFKDTTNFRGTNFRGRYVRGRGRNFETRGTNFTQQSAEVNRYNKSRTNNSSVDNQQQFDSTESYEWDDEYSEFTGSLSNTLVYTCSKNSAFEINETSVPPHEATRTVTFASVITQSNQQSFEPKIKQVAPKAFLTIPEVPPNHGCSPLKLTPPSEAIATKHPLTKKRSTNANKLMSIPPMEPKLFSKSVEMPPTTEDSDVGSLDIQFGFLDFQDESKDKVGSEQNSVKQIDSCEVVPVSISKDNASKNFNRRGSSPQSTLSDNITSSNLKETFITSPYLPTIETASNTKTSKYSYSYAASGEARYTENSAFQQMPYYVTQPLQSVPILTNISNSYQNVLGNQCQTVGNSQNVFGSEVLPTYNCATTQQNPTIGPFTDTGSKDFQSHNDNLNSASRPGEPTASTMPTSHIVSNMPPSIEHQHPVQAYVGQGGVPYFQAPQQFYIQDMHILQQQQRPPNYNYDVGYPSLTRGRVPYSMMEHSSTLQHGNRQIDVYRGQCNVLRNEGICEISKLNGSRPTSNQ